MRTVLSDFNVPKLLLHNLSLPDAPRQEKPSIGSTRVARTACDMRIWLGLCSFRVFDSLSTSCDAVLPAGSRHPGRVATTAILGASI